MANKMLIDSSHPEETRVVVTRGNRVEEFDFESASRKQLRGNIYLAKVTRVEPSLQAAFVDFGGNRHGFLAFSEIHPDYYQIPVADREALLADEAARARRDEEEDAPRRSERSSNPERNEIGNSERGNSERGNRGRRGFLGRNRNPNSPRRSENDETVSSKTVDLESVDAQNLDEKSIDFNTPDVVQTDFSVDNSDQINKSFSETEDSNLEPLQDEHLDEEHIEEDIIEQVGAGDAMEDVPRRSYIPRRQYKIQEVIKRRQILLIQVVKEERGNKGAALTTYLSLAGRYSVLMPNTARGGGISRKITNGVDRRRLKELVSDLEVPEGMGVILRTAGASRTKPEVKRDFEYLLRVWEKVRELTLESSAPALVYEEGSLVKRSIRDLYSKDIDDIQVAGEAGYREAKDFMRMLMPSHAKMVQLYREGQPLFAKYGVEEQLDAMFSSNVTLRSGGYIVINQTEALVSIDVNSGKSTREHNIEDTAIKTNLEAAEEVARQLRLRDLAGLIVIDFIDMEEHRNNRAVERKLKDCLSDDRARIQVGRISPFGLMEMSRQRIRAGVLESSTTPCVHCSGTGFMRATPSIALQVIRAIEDALLKIPHHNIIVRTRTEIALYVLNHKRMNLSALEAAYGVSITLQADETVIGSTYYVVERGEFVEAASLRTRPIFAIPELVEDPDPEIEEDLVEDEIVEDVVENSAPNEERERSPKRYRRQRGRNNGRENDRELSPAPSEDNNFVPAEGNDNSAQEADEIDEDGADAAPQDREETAEEALMRRRRRRRRGGRRNRRDRDDGELNSSEGGAEESKKYPESYKELEEYQQNMPAQIQQDADPVQHVETVIDAIEAKPKRGRPAKVVEETDSVDTTDALEAEEVAKPAVKRGRKPKVTEPEIVVSAEPLSIAPVLVTESMPIVAPVAVKELEVEDPNKPKRTGWWAKTKQALSGG
jgi:ribonuclease E